MKAVIIGGGLVGSLWSLFLKKEGWDVIIYEKRGDIRKLSADEGRSINLVVTLRGIAALKRLNLWDKVREITVPVYGRMMHDPKGNTVYQPYGRDQTECNYSVSRKDLNALLLNVAEEAGVEIHFNKELLSYDYELGLLKFKDEEVKAPVVFGTDGAGSRVRKSLPLEHDETFPLGASYKELLMPALKSGQYAMEKNALHIWPRGEFMLMGLPNLDGSFTMTLYLPDQGSVTFQDVDVEFFFKEEFPDAYELIPELQDQWLQHPVGKLATVKCAPWNYKDKCVLMGDAAHAIVPFFGQGMNCGFEDCLSLIDLLKKHSSLKKAFELYSLERKPNADAIADMAIENFIEMKEKVGDPHFLLKKQVENRLERETSYRSRYGMVMYTLMPYKEAQEQGKKQDLFLEKYLQDKTSLEDVDWNFLKEKVQNL
ncbi:MAG: FAD-dependent monooxygenase [Bdellovibrio sp.]|nr:MAG: FAD-dependent monooxygenase [Bdellovibrio sp.]